MSQIIIFYPIIGMVFLTFVIGIKMLASRIKAVKEDRMNPAFFLLNRGAKQPEYLIKVSQHYENLFELPVLFYIVIILIYITNNADYLYLSLAIVFVFIRYVHAFIHITYNNLTHRRNAFLIGTVLLFILWLRFSYQVVMLE
ncbi:MAG: MAPEG family protein [Cocleimonas sp.]|nr:MAPEG family protein [Cocleimonas sp.]